MNDLILNWKKISRGLPTGRRAANDRAPTIEEIQKLVEYPDRRIKPIVYTMASSGAWDYVQWIEPTSDISQNQTRIKFDASDDITKIPTEK